MMSQPHASHLVMEELNTETKVAGISTPLNKVIESATNGACFCFLHSESRDQGGYLSKNHTKYSSNHFQEFSIA
jgi:hypothetical protein